jgi:hypothetical protein
MTEALREAYRNNLRRYCQLLTTDLTGLEREYLHRRITETRLALERLDRGVVAPSPAGNPVARSAA